ncbi:alpha/beta fold hydrolase [Actinoalloteichus caeruleus]|uniref:Pimeloyl-ACP methyl ester carboxylesterase n=1 Tax=Actinoalloteichus caeruleus DSM 43889 TaxID=1120930 RepID=A0ABT1JDU4_ACTCY|nr:alpha/beta hydrolase [Actinoalloteichus caeruleus]MCP2330668.1 Pimeloyl-ACP methyl ester carboxylesterase [Actinoalloteichus caeruleus DSM 43889]
MSTADINGIRVQYEDVGDGEPVVLVMGSGSTGRAWHLHQVPALVSAGYRVITFDNRGSSASTRDLVGFTVEDLVADTVGLIEHLGLGPCRLVGTSMGAHVVQELLVTRADLVSQAVLMATRGRTDVMRRFAALAEREQVDSGVELPARYAASIRAMQVLSPATLNDDRKCQDWLDIFEMVPAEHSKGYRAQLDLDIIPDRLAAYRSITTPTLVIGFADDLVLPPHLCREVADAIPAARYVELADSGHYGYLERPEAVNAELVSFFAERRVR